MITKATINDLDQLVNLALLLWPHHTTEDLKEEFEPMLERENTAFFLISANGQPVGFAQCQLRQDYVEGSKSSPVGYLEGIFVMEEYRDHGYARKLLQECEQWALSKGCREFASDCELDNTTSLKFHKKTGFEEAGRIICFIKAL